jgi:hypothetical protein
MDSLRVHQAHMYIDKNRTGNMGSHLNTPPKLVAPPNSQFSNVVPSSSPVCQTVVKRSLLSPRCSMWNNSDSMQICAESEQVVEHNITCVLGSPVHVNLCRF